MHWCAVLEYCFFDFKIIDDASSDQPEKSISHERVYPYLPCQLSTPALLQPTRRPLPPRILLQQQGQQTYRQNGIHVQTRKRVRLWWKTTHQLQQVPQAQPPPYPLDPHQKQIRYRNERKLLQLRRLPERRGYQKDPGSETHGRKWNLHQERSQIDLPQGRQGRSESIPEPDEILRPSLLYGRQAEKLHFQTISSTKKLRANWGYALIDFILITNR